MTFKNYFTIILLSLIAVSYTACKVYSFTGASVEGKTINVHFIENKASVISPSLSPTFTEKLRQRILSQTSLSQLNNDKTDYDLQGEIIDYNVSVASIGGNDQSTKNRLTITVYIHFINRINEKQNFTQSFTRFADFNSSQNFQSAEQSLIATITEELADDIFNKAFVNW